MFSKHSGGSEGGCLPFILLIIIMMAFGHSTPSVSQRLVNTPVSHSDYGYIDSYIGAWLVCFVAVPLLMSLILVAMITIMIWVEKDMPQWWRKKVGLGAVISIILITSIFIVLYASIPIYQYNKVWIDNNCRHHLSTGDTSSPVYKLCDDLPQI
jgi:hypothetical protein